MSHIATLADQGMNAQVTKKMKQPRNDKTLSTIRDITSGICLLGNVHSVLIAKGHQVPANDYPDIRSAEGQPSYVSTRQDHHEGESNRNS